MCKRRMKKANGVHWFVRDASGVATLGQQSSSGEQWECAVSCGNLSTEEDQGRAISVLIRCVKCRALT